MPVYTYQALDSSGRNIKGVTRADSPRDARQKLRSEGLHPVDLREDTRAEETPAGPAGWSTRLKWRKSRSAQTAVLTRQAATLLAAGLPLVTALATIQEQAEEPDLSRTLALVREEVIKGQPLAEALSGHPDYFPNHYVHLVRAGEMAGALDAILLRLADDFERRAGRRARITAALAYPALMTLVGAGVLLFLLTFIIPTLTGLFDSLGAALPWPTRALLAFSGFFRAWWWAVLAGGVGLFFLVKRGLAQDRVYRRWEGLAFKLPLFGPLTHKLRLAQAFRGLAVMTGGGAALTTALRVTAQGLGRSNLGQALDLAAAAVGRGQPLAEGLAQSGLFPPVARRLVAVGEASGTLPEMLDRTAQAFEEETDRLLTALTALVEPVIILVMGFLVGFVVLAVLLPIFDLTSLVR